MTQRPLVNLKSRRFTVNLPTEDYERLTALAMRNTIARSTMAWIILHDWLDDNQSLLNEYYQRLSVEQGNRPSWEIEHEILGQYKRLARSGARDNSEGDRVELSLSIPSWDNRRLIGHASRYKVSKTEMWRRAVIPYLRSRDEEIAQFWNNACQWLGKPLDETKALLIADFEKQGR